MSHREAHETLPGGAGPGDDGGFPDHPNTGRAGGTGFSDLRSVRGHGLEWIAVRATRDDRPAQQVRTGFDFEHEIDRAFIAANREGWQTSNHRKSLGVCESVGRLGRMPGGILQQIGPAVFIGVGQLAKATLGESVQILPFAEARVASDDPDGFQVKTT